MADTPIQFDFAAGETLMVELYPEGSDTIANGAGDAAAEATNRDGTYTITVAEALTGLHQLKLFAAAAHVGTLWVDIKADDATTYHAESSRRLAALNDLSAAQVNAEVDAALADYDGPTRADATADKDEVLAAIPTAADIEAAMVNAGDGTDLLQLAADKLADDLTVGDLTAAANASAVRAELATELGRLDVALSSLPNSTRDAILDRVLAGNHDTAGTVGKLLQSLGITFAPGTAGAASAGATTLTITGLAMDASKYKKQYLLLQEGDGQGFATEILATSTGTTFNLKDPLPADVTLNDAVLIVGKAR